MVGFPLLLIPLAIYNNIVLLMPGVSFADPLIKLTLMSGAEWQVTLSDILLAVGLVLLLPKFGNSTFCLLALLAMVDFLSGVALRTRRATAVSAAPVVSKRARKAE